MCVCIRGHVCVCGRVCLKDGFGRGVRVKRSERKPPVGSWDRQTELSSEDVKDRRPPVQT